MDTNKHEFVVEAAVSAANVFRFAREDTPRYTGGQLKELFLGVELPEVSDRARGAATQRPVAEL